MGALWDCYLLSAATCSYAFHLFLGNHPLPLIFKSAEELEVLLAIVLSSNPDVCRQEKIMIWSVPPAYLATVKLKRLRMTLILSQVLQTRWSSMNEVVFFITSRLRLWWQDCGKKSKADLYDNLNQIRPSVRIWHVSVEIYLHNRNVVRALLLHYFFIYGTTLIIELLITYATKETSPSFYLQLCLVTALFFNFCRAATSFHYYFCPW